MSPIEHLNHQAVTNTFNQHLIILQQTRGRVRYVAVGAVRNSALAAVGVVAVSVSSLLYTLQGFRLVLAVAVVPEARLDRYGQQRLADASGAMADDQF